MATRWDAFDGKTYDPTDDYDRLKTCLEKVKHLMTKPYGQWWTLAELSRKTGSSESGISARIRDLRKEKNGSHQVESVRENGGLWKYRVCRPEIQDQINLFN